jgi:hypothetical protein
MPRLTLHNPLANAAQDIKAVAKETNSPLVARFSVFALIASAAASTALAAVQAWHMLRRDFTGPPRQKEPQPHSPPPPPEPPAHLVTAGGEEHRWRRREEHAHSPARQR